MLIAKVNDVNTKTPGELYDLPPMLKRLSTSDGDPDRPDLWLFLEDPGSVKNNAYGSRILIE